MHLRVGLIIIACAAWLGLGHVSAASAAPPPAVFTYQGVLKQAGQAVNGTHDLEFRLFDAPTGGTALGTITLAAQVITNGLVTASLDFGALAFAGEARWLEIQINSTTLAPRQSVAVAPYALYALSAAYVPLSSFPTGGAWTLSSSLNLDSGTLHVDPSSNRVGIGTSSPATALDVAGTARVTGFQMPTGAADGKVLRSDSTGAATWQVDGLTLPFETAVDLQSPDYGFHITNNHSVDAIAIRGSAPTGTFCFGVYGDATAGVGVQGFATSGIGVIGQVAHITAANYGGLFRSASSSGRGVRGVVDNATGSTIGGEFESKSTVGIGAYGLTSATSGSNYGGYFQSRSTLGIGALGYDSATSGFTTGLWGKVESPVGIGVYGFCVPSTGTGAGVYGECPSATGHGVYALGRFAASGTKAFRIDHPDDPTGKYLMHYCAESPEVINFYSGKVTLDATGQAIVELPAYFAKINRDPRYTLTAIGAAMPNLHIAQEIDDAALELGAHAEPAEAAPICWFGIAGGAPNAKVSWRVEAVRNDRFMQQHGAPVEQDKVEHERGRYQQPELYGQPREMSETYRPEVVDRTPRTDAREQAE